MKTLSHLRLGEPVSARAPARAGTLPRLEVKQVEIREIRDARVLAFTRLRWEVVTVSEHVHPVLPFPIALELGR